MILKTLFGHIWIFASGVIFGFCEGVRGFNDRTKEITLTTIVQPGYSDCFYEDFRQGSTVMIDYQVVSMGNNDNSDISFHFNSPSGREILNEHKQTESSSSHLVSEEGIHELCFDNSFSTFTSKVVFFEIYVERDINDIPEPRDSTGPAERGLDLASFHRSVNHIQSGLIRARHLLEMSRAAETRHLKAAQAKASRVTTWSLLQIGVMLVVAGVQVALVRSLIDETSKFRLFWTCVFGRHA